MGRISVALISNGVRLAQGNAFYLGGNAATSGTFGAERGVAWSPAARRLFACGLWIMFIFYSQPKFHKIIYTL
jgi:hypothetical protein